MFSIFSTITCPAPRCHTAKKTDSTRDYIATVAGSNMYTLTLIQHLKHKMVSHRPIFQKF